MVTQLIIPPVKQLNISHVSVSFSINKGYFFDMISMLQAFTFLIIFIHMGRLTSSKCPRN